MKCLFRDYFLSENGVLIKKKLVEAKHLMWKFQGTPCIDAGLWDRNKYLIKLIRFTTDKERIFEVKASDFEANKISFDDNFGRQYRIPKELWNITSLKAKEEKTLRLL